MRGVLCLVLAASAAGCAVESFDYRATVTFTSDLGTVRLNHQPVSSATVWSAMAASSHNKKLLSGGARAAYS